MKKGGRRNCFSYAISSPKKWKDVYLLAAKVLKLQLVINKNFKLLKGALK